MAYLPYVVYERGTKHPRYMLGKLAASVRLARSKEFRLRHIETWQNYPAITQTDTYERIGSESSLS